MTLSIADRVILLLGTLTSLFFFVAPFKLYGLSYLTIMFKTQGQIVTVTLAILLIKSIIDTMIGRSFPPREGD
jgi:hypothetical protein